MHMDCNKETYGQSRKPVDEIVICQIASRQERSLLASARPAAALLRLVSIIIPSLSNPGILGQHGRDPLSIGAQKKPVAAHFYVPI